MDDFQIIYKILKALKAAMDLPEFDIEQISAETLGISYNRWAAYMKMMLNAGLIEGITIQSFPGSGISVVGIQPCITLKGLEYLSENTLMQRVYKTAKGISDLIP